MGRDKDKIDLKVIIPRIIYGLFFLISVVFGSVWLTITLAVLGLVLFSEWLEGLYISTFAFVYLLYGNWNNYHILYFVSIILIYILAQIVRKNIYR